MILHFEETIPTKFLKINLDLSNVSPENKSENISRNIVKTKVCKISTRKRGILIRLLVIKIFTMNYFYWLDLL